MDSSVLWVVVAVVGFILLILLARPEADEVRVGDSGGGPADLVQFLGWGQGSRGA
jgi:hypothetical protein